MNGPNTVPAQQMLMQAPQQPVPFEVYPHPPKRNPWKIRLSFAGIVIILLIVGRLIVKYYLYYARESDREAETTPKIME